MSDTHQDHEREAREQLASRIQAMGEYLALNEDGKDVDDENDVPEELGLLGEWGLEWTKTITDHRHETVTYVHVLSTGGPHDEFNVTFDPSKGTVESVRFVYLPWGDRVEWELFSCPAEDCSLEQAQTVKDFYETFFGYIVEAEYEGAEH